MQALESLLERPGGRRFDYILIETSGLANPGPIATALWTDAELESRVSLDGCARIERCRVRGKARQSGRELVLTGGGVEAVLSMASGSAGAYTPQLG